MILFDCDALRFAAKSITTDPALLPLLIAGGENVNGTSICTGWTPFHYLLRTVETHDTHQLTEEYLTKAKHLIAAGFNPSERVWTDASFFDRSYYGNLHALAFFLLSVAQSGQTAFKLPTVIAMKKLLDEEGLKGGIPAEEIAAFDKWFKTVPEGQKTAKEIGISLHQLIEKSQSFK